MKMKNFNRQLSLIMIWLIITLPFAGAQQTSPPTITITNVQINHGTQTVITWQTNLLGTGTVEWGNTSSLGTNTTTPQGTLHTATLNTIAGQTYYYRIVSCETTCTSTQIDAFTAGPLFITTSVPPYVRNSNIDIPGRTRAGAKVELYVNSIKVREQNTSTEAFVFKGVQIQPVNNITLKTFFGSETAETSFTVRVDNEPPRITVDIPKIATQPSVVAHITTTEPVNVTVTSRRVDAKAPARPTSLVKQSVTNNRIELSWNNVSDATEYLIVRDGLAIGKTTNTNYADTTVGADTQYDYEIKAVNAACMTSDPSAILAITTPGGTNTQLPIIIVKPTCERDAQNYLVTSSADITVALVEGENLVTFTAIDSAGFESVIEESVIYDLAPPQFLEQNLEQLSPSYSPQVVIRGKLSEKGSVTVFVNDKAVQTKATDDDGSFTIPVLLERNLQVTTDPLSAGLDTGTGFSNKLKLEATDVVGQKTSTENVDVIYAICGFGTDFDIKIESPLPDVLNPRLLYEGIQQVGIAFSYEYKGAYNAVVNPGMVRPKLIQLAPAVAKEYDNNLVTPSHYVQGKRGKQNAGEGYIQLTFTPLKDPWTAFGLDKKPSNPTLYDSEDAISSHRMAYKDLKIKECKTPGVGCMRLFMELEIPYQITTQSQQYLPEQPYSGQIQAENKVQRTCIDVELAIDRRASNEILPQGFLKGMSETLGAIIEGVDVVLKPLRTIYQYLFYTCVAGWFISYVPTFLEQYNCKYANIASAVSGEGKFDEGVAAINSCKVEYQGKQESLDNCEACATWKKNKKWIQDVYKQICDRVACPAAPSLQYYLKTKGTSQLTAVNAPKATANLGQYTSKTGGQLYQGSDCAAWMQQKPREQIAQSVKAAMEGTNSAAGKPIFSQGEINAQVLAAQNAKIPPSNFFSTQDIESIYQDWLKHRSDSRSDDVKSGVVNCAAPHPATPECCGYEYMDQWGSACGIGGTLVGQGIDTFDEIEQSTCLAAEKANRQTIGTGDTAVSCGGISNALAGFCTAEGGTPLEYVRVTTFSGSATDNTGKLAELGIGKASDHYLYILLVPPPGEKAAFNYNIKLGYIVEEIEFAQTEQGKKVDEKNKYDVNKKMRAVELSSPSVAEYFSQQNIDNYYAGKLNADVYNKLQTTLCSAAGKTSGCDVNGKTMYDSVMSKIGKPDQEYIIDPRKGIINAIRCICLPAVISYLQLWRNIMAAVKNCVDTIRFTGDGNPGVCQEMISKYACDLIYEALACFTEKFSVGGGRPGGRDLFGALTSAGTEMSNDIQGRYGQTSMYNSMFTQGQIVKSVCNFAFTGTWSLDFGAIADSSIDDIPIESQSFLYPCDRRFVSFNPLTTPKGLTTWVYHFGVFVAAGANLDIEFALKCSGGYKCSENDGFERGKCDCDTEKILTIAPTDLPTKAAKDEIVDSAVYYTVAGDPAGTIRYDKAVLTYKWKDGTGKEAKKSLECRINQLGGAPNFCRFDLFTGAYRCQFGPEQGGLQFEQPVTNYAHVIPEGGVYTLNENINISLPIRQAYRGKVSETKFLEWTITGPGGVMVENNTADIMRLANNGDYVKNIGVDPFSPKVAVKQSWFGSGTTTATTAGQTTSFSYWTPGLSAPKPDTWVQSFTYLEDGKTPNSAKYFVLKKQGSSFNLYNAGSNAQLNKDTGFVGKTTQLCTLTKSGNTYECTASITPAQQGAQPIPQRATFQLSSTLPTTDAEVYVTTRPTTGATGDFCSGENKYKPVTFTMKLIGYDADDLGQISDQISLNPITNEEARATASFQAVCADVNDQKFKDMETLAKGQTPPMAGIDKWKQLKQQLEKMYTMENGYLVQLSALQTLASSNPSAFVSQAGGLATTIQQIQQAESTELTKLSSIINVPTNDGTVTPEDVENLVKINLPTQGPLGQPVTAPGYLYGVVGALNGLNVNITTSIIQQGEYAGFMTTKVNEAIAILGWIQPQKILAINSLNKNLGINVCETGYKEGVATGCFASKPNDPLWSETGATCAAGKCYQAKMANLYVNNQEIKPGMNSLPPGQTTFAIKIPLIKESDLTQNPKVGILSGVSFPFGVSFTPITSQLTSKPLLNNVKEFTFTQNLMTSTAFSVLTHLNETELYFIPVQETIDVAAGEISSKLISSIKTQSTYGKSFERFSKFTDTYYEDSTRRTEIRNAARGAITIYDQLQTDFNQMSLAPSAQIYLNTIKSDLTQTIQSLNQFETVLTQSTPPSGQSWTIYLKSQLQGTGNNIRNIMGKTFTDSLVLYDNLNPRTFSVNGALNSVTVPARGTLNLQGTKKYTCAYKMGAHFFAVDQRCWFGNETTIPFTDYMLGLPYGTYEFRSLSVEQGGTEEDVKSWTNGVSVTLQEPTIYQFDATTANPYPAKSIFALSGAAVNPSNSQQSAINVGYYAPANPSDSVYEIPRIWPQIMLNDWSQTNYANNPPFTSTTIKFMPVSALVQSYIPTQSTNVQLCLTDKNSQTQKETLLVCYSADIAGTSGQKTAYISYVGDLPAGATRGVVYNSRFIFDYNGATYKTTEIPLRYLQ